MAEWRERKTEFQRLKGGGRWRQSTGDSEELGLGWRMSSGELRERRSVGEGSANETTRQRDNVTT